MAPIRDLILERARERGLSADVIKRRYTYEDNRPQLATLTRYFTIEGQTCVLLYPRTKAKRATVGTFARVTYATLRRVQMVVVYATISPLDARTYVIPAADLRHALFHDSATRTSALIFVPFGPCKSRRPPRINLPEYEDAWHNFG